MGSTQYKYPALPPYFSSSTPFGSFPDSDRLTTLATSVPTSTNIRLLDSIAQQVEQHIAECYHWDTHTHHSQLRHAVSLLQHHFEPFRYRFKRQRARSSRLQARPSRFQTLSSLIHIITMDLSSSSSLVEDAWKVAKSGWHSYDPRLTKPADELLHAVMKAYYRDHQSRGVKAPKFVSTTIPKISVLANSGVQTVDYFWSALLDDKVIRDISRAEDWDFLDEQQDAYIIHDVEPLQISDDEEIEAVAPVVQGINHERIKVAAAAFLDLSGNVIAASAPTADANTGSESDNPIKKRKARTAKAAPRAKKPKVPAPSEATSDSEDSEDSEDSVADASHAEDGDETIHPFCTKLTKACGIPAPNPNKGRIIAAPRFGKGVRSSKKPAEGPKPKAMNMGCGICDEYFLDHRALFSHFPGCCHRNGNPNGISWWDHLSIDENAIVAASVIERSG